MAQRQAKQVKQERLRPRAAPPPRGWQQLKWLGPGFLWALSSVGAGEIYYSARVGARYHYALLWAAPAVIALTWVIISEIARYTIVSGETILHGYRKLPGPGRWAVWFLFVAQIVNMTAAVAGHAALSAGVLLQVIPLSLPLIASVLILVAATIVVLSAYRWVNLLSATFAVVLLSTVLITVAKVFPGFGTLAGGFVPTPPKNLDISFVLPWIGFLVIMGAPWFSYWIGKQNFAGPLRHPLDELASDEPPGKMGGQQSDVTGEDARKHPERFGRNIRGWHHLAVKVAGFGSVIALLFTLSFVLLGAQLLADSGGKSVPSGAEVGRQLAQGLKNSWGQIGFWLFLVTAAGAFWTSVLDVSDGAARLLADGTLILLPDRFVRATTATESAAKRSPHQTQHPSSDNEAGNDSPARQTEQSDTLGDWLLVRHHLVSFYIVVFTVVLPIGLLLLVGDPMKILAAAGVASAAQAPFFAFFTIWTNHRLLPREYRPGWIWTIALAVAGLFFAAVSSLYFLNRFGLNLFSGSAN